MKYSEYPYPNFVLRSELEMSLIPVYAGCNAGEFGCGCIGTCARIIDHLTIDEVKEKNVRII
jgi:hypothetical protein